MSAPIVALIIASIADVVTTIIALRDPALRESNSGIASLMRSFGKGWIVLKVGLTVTIGALYQSYDVMWPIWLCAGILAAISSWNVYFITRKGSR